MERKWLLIPFGFNFGAMILTQLLISHPNIIEMNPITNVTYQIFGNFFVWLIIIWSVLFIAVPKMMDNIMRKVKGNPNPKRYEMLVILLLSFYFFIDFFNNLLVYVNLKPI